ncbi:PREDICTED: protein NRT1/ PTR FAMILY 2.10 [Theobroma cacao]|uniref:Protein NRT1/ PTR FAMILY 2.10 n=1 Tax=Theobroma cacao TaxID=3641 RepID=A0AB32W7U7_THECC|nr:PREDICTED: protein NRT1/ PTR FAMILY 2.10 [Theobroma cacao]
MEKTENGSTATTTDEPKINYRGIKAMPFVIGNETFEKLGTTGTATNLLVYLTAVFNMKSITATNLVNVFNGTCSFATLIGAFLSDTYFGRYKTLGFASVASLLGMLLVTLTAAVSKLHPPACDSSGSAACPGPTPWQMAFLLSGLGLLVVGAAGIRPCNLAFGADQFNPETESGKRGISSFFNWYYFTFTFAMMVSLTVIVFVQTDVSWAWGLGIPAFMMFLSCVMFFIGTRIYVKVRPEGSPITSVIQVMVAAVRKRQLKQPEQPWVSLFNHIPKSSINSKLSYSDQLRFLNKAAILTPEDEINSDGSAANPWRLCSLQKVEEIKCVIRVVPIWAAGIIYYVAMVQQQTYVVFQALQSNRHLGNTGFNIPAASYGIFIMIGLTIWIPIYDRIIVPWLQRYTKKEGGITLLQKMGIGMVLAIVTMLLSAIVEDRRRAFALSKPIGIDSRRRAISSLSAMWYIPQLTLIGLSEAFTIIALMEFYYKQFPENMRSIAGSFTHIGFALANYLNSILISVVHKITKVAPTGDWLPEDLNKGKLDYIYYLVAALEVLNLGYFIMCAKWCKYKESVITSPDVGMEDLQSEKPVV